MPDLKSKPLFQCLVPAGPVANTAAADRLHDTLIEAAAADGWSETLTAAWHALTPVAGASPYLTGLMRRRPAHLRRLLEGDPAESLARILGDADALDGEPDDVRAPLRVLKADLHLLTALADLGGVWDLDQVTEALSQIRRRRLSRGPARRRRRAEGARSADFAARRFAWPRARPVRRGHGQARRQ